VRREENEESEERREKSQERESFCLQTPSLGKERMAEVPLTPTVILIKEK